MVSSSSALGCSGVHEWLLTRLSATLIFFYIIYLFSFILTTDTFTYEIWRSFFSTKIKKAYTLLTLFFILIHTWIGMWHILTDYVKPIILQLLLQLAVIILLTVYLIYGTIIVWGV